MQRKAEFDGFAQNYVTFHDYPASKHIFEPSVLHFLGDVTGKSVLDLGCGDGYYARIIKRMGANRVLGVDVSTEMIKMAQHHEQSAPLGIEYLVSEITSLNLCGQFDIVCMIFVLPYANDQKHMLEMCRVAYDHLLPGGKLVAITCMLQPFRDEYDYEELGFKFTHTGFKNGDPFGTIRMYSLGHPIHVIVDTDVCLFYIEMYEHCLEKVGFHQVQFKQPTVISGYPSQFGKELWESIGESKFFQGIVCLKHD